MMCKKTEKGYNILWFKINEIMEKQKINQNELAIKSRSK